MFNLAKGEQFPAKIRVIGVGGCGGNVINYMIEKGINGVEFWAMNTDAQDLKKSLAKEKVQLGERITGGNGAGGDPKIGREAAEESREDIKAAIGDANMVFIVAGMGGGTGTGASPVVASLAREMGALTVAVVTKPATFEGRNRMRIAEEGIAELSKVADTIVIIPNDKIMAIKNIPLAKALGGITAEIPAKAVQGMAEMLIKEGLINLDFEDLKKIMSNSGRALLGVGIGEGENKAVDAIQEALNCPFLEDFEFSQAKKVLLNLTIDGETFTNDELNEIMEYVHSALGDNIELVFGVVVDNNIKDSAKVTLIATGIENREVKMDTLYISQGFRHFPQVENKEIKRDDLEIPTFLRRQSD